MLCAHVPGINQPLSAAGSADPPALAGALLYPTLPRGRYPAAPAFHNRYPRGSKVLEDFSFN